MARLPEALRRLLERGSPEQVFCEAETHFEAVVLGMVSTRPFSGAPLLGFFVPGSAAILPAFACTYFTPAGVQATKFFHVSHLIVLDVVPLNEAFGDLLRRLNRAHLDETAQDAWLASEAPTEPPPGYDFLSTAVSADCQVGEVLTIALTTGHHLKLEVKDGWPGADIRVAVPRHLATEAARLLRARTEEAAR